MHTFGAMQRLKKVFSGRKDSDLTTGPFVSKIIRFAVPVMLTNLFQLLFNAADLVVVGRTCGDHYLGAVGATSALIHLLVYFFIGFSVGTGVVVAQGLGARDDEAVHRAVHTAIPTAAICGVLLSVAGIIGARQFLVWMGTPEDILPLSTLYLRIYLLGTAPFLIYNYGAAVLRAAGDTSTPMLILVASGVLNVGMNLIFVLVFGMTVDGVALATVLSQAASGVLVMLALMRREDACRLRLRKLRIHKKSLAGILRIGLPAGLQSSLFSISNVIIQSSVNTFGSVVLSGNTAGANLEGFVYVCLTSFYHAVMNFVGQNLGARKLHNVKKCIRICTAGTTVLGLVLGVLVNVFARQLLSIYLSGAPEEAYRAGMDRLLILCMPYAVCGIMDVMTGTLRGAGYSLQPMFITVIGTCGIRLFWAFVLFRFEAFHSLRSLFLSYPVSWTLTAAAEFVCILLLWPRIKARAEAPRLTNRAENDTIRQV